LSWATFCIDTPLPRGIAYYGRSIRITVECSRPRDAPLRCELVTEFYECRRVVDIVCLRLTCHVRNLQPKCLKKFFFTKHAFPIHILSFKTLVVQFNTAQIREYLAKNYSDILRMAAQHLPRDLVRPSSGLKELTQRTAATSPRCHFLADDRTRMHHLIDTLYS